ncbi:DUF3967 domain-containing protein [Bacillus safensis]|uniref:DUF3967 domain-containing protein n=1 Tax=Bacillus safensis TaxID=561879 RepID=UPI001B3A3371|nr:DUF3967 domain-containing protein [Bacillus safensis]MBQ4874472.1 DUF3967 domain-containing protein [Bacillus safensis]
MDNQETWHSIKSLEKELQIPDTTLRRYIRQHGHHLNIKKNGKSYLINHTESTALTLNESIKDIKNTLNSQMNEQKQIIQSLIQTIHEQQHYIEAKLEERDKHLIEALKENEEMKKQIAAAQQKKWWQFWK